MAEPITDAHVAAVLRTFVRSTAPMLDRLRHEDEPVVVDETVEGDRSLLDKLKAQLAAVRMPGTHAWNASTVDERTDWWVNRVGRLTALIASFTGLAGAVGDRFPVQDMLGSAGQGLLLCAIAAEHGVTDRGTRVRLLAAVLFDRDIDQETASGKGTDEQLAAEDDRKVAELAADETVITTVAETGSAAVAVPGTGTEVGAVAEPDGPKKPGRFGIKSVAKMLWRQGRMLLAISDELEKRPHGRFYHRALGKLPIVGMAGDYLGERSALKRAARTGTKWLATHY